MSNPMVFRNLSSSATPEEVDCASRTPACGIIGPHTHADRPGGLFPGRKDLTALGRQERKEDGMSQGTMNRVPGAIPSLAEWEPVNIGDHVLFFDPKGVPHNALITAIWGTQDAGEIHDQYRKTCEAMAENPTRYGSDKPSYSLDDLVAAWKPPSVNLVFVSGDETRSDSFGRQIERPTSVNHTSTQTAHGYYWEK